MPAIVLTYVLASTVDASHGMTLREPVQILIGPITRARVKKFKDALNGLIQEIWSKVNSWRPIELGPPDLAHHRCINLIQILEDSNQNST